MSTKVSKPRQAWRDVTDIADKLQSAGLSDLADELRGAVHPLLSETAHAEERIRRVKVVERKRAMTEREELACRMWSNGATLKEIAERVGLRTTAPIREMLSKFFIERVVGIRSYFPPDEKWGCPGWVNLKTRLSRDRLPEGETNYWPILELVDGEVQPPEVRALWKREC